jgi:hypothetical protein
MAKYSHAGSFNFKHSGKKNLVVVPRRVDGTLAISNNSSKPFVLLINNIVNLIVNPYTIAQTTTTSGGSTTKIAIRTTGGSTGSYIFQEK